MLNQEKTGKFIAERRKTKELTQKQLAERLNVSDKAVSKWETGRSMPDNAILLELCQILDINVNELLSGEKLSDENYHGKAEENMMTLINEKKKVSRVKGIIGFLLGVLFIVWCMQMTAGNITWYLDMPSIIMDLVLVFILLFMSGLTKDFVRGIFIFFGKNKELTQEKLERTLAAFKLVLIGLPIGGVVVAFITFVAILGKINDISEIGPYFAVAILTILYSLVLEILLLPMAAKLWIIEKEVESI